jgi:hypothetical protein
LDSGTVTTTEPNVLLIYAWGFDGAFQLIPENPDHLTELGKTVSLGACQIVGYRNQITAGTSQVVRALSAVASEGGTALVIGISDVAPSTAQLAPRCTTTYSIFKRYGGTPAAAAATAAFTRHDGITWDPLSSISASVVDGVSTIDLTLTIVDSPLGVDRWGSMTAVTTDGSAIDSAGRWTGASHAVTSTNLSNKVFAIEWGRGSSGGTLGSKGWVVVFQSSVGNWKAFQLSPLSSDISNISYFNIIDLANTTAYASAGTINWSAITRVAYLLTDEQVMEALLKRGYKVRQILEWFQRKGLL